ncbi:MAG TPA: DUF4381 family protein [Candidatus Babeliales bacterium]|jgi:hypothetical protein|nr:DUF4381 family protein [Candidatus Babeliales bacterium]
MKLNEKTGLYENYGLWHVPIWQTEKFQLGMKIAAGLLLFLVVAYGVRKYMQYRKRKKLPLWDQALAHLNQLKQEHKVDVVYGKEFYVTVSVLLKKYFYDRFGYDVIGKTDDEMIQYLQEHYPDAQSIDDIKALLQGSVIIKFANVQAAQEQIDHDYVRSIAIITRTIPEKQR